MNRCFRFGLLAVAWMSMFQPQLLHAASDELPRVALYAFESSSKSPEDQNLANVASELLLVALSQSGELELLDRSFLQNVLQEKSLAGSNRQPSGHADELRKLPTSQFVVTGTLANDGSNSYLYARLVDPATGLVHDSIRVPVNTANINHAVATIADFVQKLSSQKATRKPGEGLRIGIGTFRDASEGTRSLGQGDVLRDDLVLHYGQTFDLFARSEVFPLYLESYISRLQFKQNESDTAGQVSLYVTGEYVVTPSNDATPIKLVLTLHNIRAGYRQAALIEGRDWSDVVEQTISYLDPYFAPPGSVSDADRAASINRYDAAFALNEYKPGVRGHFRGKQWLYPFPRWNDKTKPLATETVDLLEEALELDPWNPEARLLLAYTLIKLAGPNDAIGRKHLEWLLFHVDHPPANKLARQSLSGTPFHPDTFIGIVPQPQILYTQLVNAHYLDEDGSLAWTRVKPNPLENNWGYSERQTIQIYNVLVQSGRILAQDPDFFDFLGSKSVRGQAQLHFFASSQVSGVKFHHRGDLVLLKVETKQRDQRRMVELYQAIDDFSVTAILDRNFYTGQLFLAHALRTYDERYRTYSDVVFEDVLHSSSDDNTRYLAALPIDGLLQTDFTQIFEHGIKDEIAAAKMRHGIVDEEPRAPAKEIETLNLDEAEIDAYNHIVNGETAINEVSVAAFSDEIDARNPVIAHEGLSIVDGQLVVGLRAKSIKRGLAALYSRSAGLWKMAQTVEGSKPRFGSEYDWFGHSIDTSKDLLIVGAPRDDHWASITREAFASSQLADSVGSDKLIAMLFERGYIDVYGMPTSKYGEGGRKGALQDFPELTSEQTSALMRIVSSMASQDDVGTAYVFRKTGMEWELEAHLSAPDAYIENQFGHSVAIDQDTALVCAHGRFAGIHPDEQLANNEGGAYLFEKNASGWEYTAKIASGMCFGAALSNGFAFVGSGNSLLVFRKNNGQWDLWQSLAITAGLMAVSDTGQHMVIGSTRDDKNPEDRHSNDGAVYVFELIDGKYQLEGKIFPPGNDTSSIEFGSAVAISEDYMAVGASNLRGSEHSSAGKIYLYERADSHWQLNTIIAPSVEPYEGRFRGALALNDYVLVMAASVAARESKLYQYQLADEPEESVDVSEAAVEDYASINSSIMRIEYLPYIGGFCLLCLVYTARRQRKSA